MKRNRSSIKLIALHFSLMAILGSGILFLFFQFLLPILTHHGQFVTVPNLKGVALEDVDAHLAQRNLRFKITEEFAYAPNYPPMAVLQQYPQAGSRVKERRKIYLTLNTQTPPQVEMPDLVDGSVRNAYMRLKSQGLLLGTIKYVPDIAHNAVLEQWYQGKEISAGTLITLGAKIDLVVGAGLGDEIIEVPQVVGMRLEEAKSLLLSIGVKVGDITYEYDTGKAPGTILRQNPAAGQPTSIGDNMDLWLEGYQAEEVVVPDAPMLPRP